MGIYDSLRGLTKSLCSGTQKRLDKRFEGGDDKDRNGVRDLLNETGKAWDSIDGVLQR